MRLFVIGPAGSGKSVFVKEFGDYLKDRGYEVCRVNLDPATEPIYKADYNIREFVKTEEVMKLYNLGVNGALIKSVELAAKWIDKLRCEADYVLYDTPGQMELFIYSESGRKFVDQLSNGFTAGLFLMDLTAVSDAESFLSAVLQNVVVSLRLSLPTLTVFTKADLADIDVNKLRAEIAEKEGVLAELLEKVVFFIEYTTIPYRIIKISNKSRKGFDEVFSAINELFCACGDIS